MNNITIVKGNTTYKRITKKTARNAFNNGLIVIITPCKANPYFIGAAWYETSKNETTPDFDKMVNSFEYYNCFSEVGYYASFYIPVRHNSFDGILEYDFDFLENRG